ncbi:hypothetical protein B0H14DRAFT_3864002 [Mycena olivaceomarginata]|nr:hypothetical protein B0H14DRAFT_3864002 [Mycena olivaceomarginata]
MSNVCNPVAIITGASSGIGLALTQHLLTKNYDVVLLDLNPHPRRPTSPPQTPSSIRTDTTATASSTPSAPPPALPPTEPNLYTFSVNLLGVYSGIKLFAHYASLPSPAKPSPGGAIVVTASAAGSTPSPPSRSHHTTNFTINAVCPDMVPTGLAPPGLMEAYPAAAKTPMATMLRAYDELLGLIAGGGRSRNGQVVEVVVEDLYYRKEPRPQRKAAAVGPEVAALWDRVYRERNIAFARKAEEEARKRMAEERNPEYSIHLD